MSLEIAYKLVRSIPVEGHSWDTVDGLSLPQQRIPFKEGHLESLCRFVVSSSENNITSPQLVQVTPAEKRTFEVRFGETGKIIFEDEYGNLFGCLDLKGNKSTIIKVKKTNSAPSGFSFWGIQESDSLARAVRASDYTRSLNVDTEIILKVEEPEEIPYKGKTYSPEDFKTQLLLDSLKRVSSKNGKKDKLTPTDIPALALALEGMSFIQTLRGKQVNERLYDLLIAPPQAVRQMIENAFWFYNYRSQHYAADEETFKPLDAENPVDINKFFRVILPAHIGGNYGALHEGMVIHVHPHLQNISLLGGICDTDSVKGFPLGFGDPQITDKDTIDEMQKLLYGYWNNQEGIGLIPFVRQLGQQQKIPLLDQILLAERFESGIIMSYLFGRRWDEDLLSHLEKLQRILNHPERAFFSFTPHLILKLLNNTNQWGYEFELVNIGGIAEEMFKSNLDLWRHLVKNEVEDGQLVDNIFRQSSDVGVNILRRRIYDSNHEAFDSVSELKGAAEGKALLELVVMKFSSEFPLAALDEMYGDDRSHRDPERARQYILDKISQS